MFYQYLHHLKSDWTCGRIKLLFFNLDITGFQIFFTPLITIFRKKSFFLNTGFFIFKNVLSLLPYTSLSDPTTVDSLQKLHTAIFENAHLDTT